MTTGKKFCANCGNPLEVGGKFCAYCGSPLSGAQSASSAPPSPMPSPPPPPPLAPEPNAPLAAAPATPAATENIIGVIPGISRMKGIFKVEAYHIVVTEKRLIFAIVTNQAMKEEAQKSSGKGFGGFLKTAISGNDLTPRYINMPPEQALHETPGNFSVDLSAIRKVKVEQGMEFLDDRKENEGKLIIETAGEKLSFILRNHYYKIARETLHKAGLS